MLVSLGLARHSPEEWKSRIIYQVITDRFAGGSGLCDLNPSKQPYYCGGNFQGIIDKLDYIKGMGFDAIWISPIVENTKNGFHGYWLKNLYKINSHFGGETGFKNLIQAAHNTGIWIMVDVVANHVGQIGDDFEQIYPFNRREHYHDDCEIDFNNWWSTQNCRLSGLPDLKQENLWVKDTLINWIGELVTKYDIDGLRIDTIPEVPKWFWKEFVAKANCYSVGEVDNSNSDYVYQFVESVGAVLNYPQYSTATSVFGNQQTMKNFEYFYNGLSKYSMNQKLLAVFADNHDNPRFLSYQKDRIKFKSYVTFALSAIGIPIVYYGTEQYYAGGKDPWNRESLWGNYNTQSDMYKTIGLINYYRKKTKWYEADQLQMYCDDDFYAFERGNAFMAFTNKRYNIHRIVTYDHLKDGIMCNIFYKSDCITIKDHKADVYLDNGEAKIFVYQETLEQDHSYYKIEQNEQIELE